MNNKELELKSAADAAEKRMQEEMDKLLQRDFESIRDKKLMMMGVVGDALADSYTYTYTGCVAKGFELTVVGTSPSIASSIINGFYDLDLYGPNDPIEAIVDRLGEMISTVGPRDGRKEGHPPVPFDIRVVDAKQDAEQYALRRKYLNEAMQIWVGIDNLVYPVIRLTFLE